MYVKKNFSFKSIMQFTGGHLIWIGLWATFVTAIFEYTHSAWLHVPWFLLSVIGTAVAFYIGFKNNQAYDRLWEARKIWGAIVNSSRAWGSAVKGFTSNVFTEKNFTAEELRCMQQKLIYRHIAWLYALRSQLLIPTSWEHISQGGHMKRSTEKRMKRFGVGLLDDEVTSAELTNFLPKEEYERLINYKNTATQIIDQQSQDLKEFRAKDVIDDFRHMELQKILYDFYVHQGKCERIKKFPLPRQYGSSSYIFVGIFIFLLPFGLVTELHGMGDDLTVWLTIPFTMLVGWLYIMMELVGDYSENPFEGLGNDIPMLSLCRVIEIDLLEMMGVTDLPPAIEAKNGVLM